jgi:hypothetical protein
LTRNHPAERDQFFVLKPQLKLMRFGFGSSVPPPNIARMKEALTVTNQRSSFIEKIGEQWQVFGATKISG